MRYSCNNVIKENFLESLLRSRGIDNYLEYLNPKPESLCNPYDLDNISEATDLLLEKLEDKTNEIHLIVDCDNDGYTSSAMLWNYIKEQYPEAKLRYHIHSGKQHGLEDMIDNIEDSKEKIDLMLIADASSNDYEYHKRLKNIGIPIIVLDHHEAEKYSENAIVVNNQLSKNYLNKGLSGAGVVYKFLKVLDDKLGIQKADNYMDLAAIGMIGDMMTVTTIENRYIISKGLSNIKNNCIKEIINSQSFSIKDKDHITPTIVSFYIVPLINAVIRVGRESEKETLFLSLIDGEKMVPKISRNKIVEGQFESLGEQNVRNCTNARSRQNRAKDKAIEQLEIKIVKNSLDENKVIFVELDESNDFPSELNGLIATQLMAKYKKPVIVARENDEGFLRGSIRGDSKSALKDFRQFLIDSKYFEYAEGHASAAGCSIEKKKLESFINYANKELANVDFNEGVYEANFIFDAEEGNKISEAILDLTRFPEIYGKDNEEPLIVIKNIKLTKNDIVVYSNKTTTVKFTYDGIDYLKFFADDFKKELESMSKIELTIIGKANKNEWQGVVKPQIFIEDYNLRNPIFDF